MSASGPTLQGLVLEFAGLAASSGTVQERAADIFERLGRFVAFDVGWLALRDPSGAATFRWPRWAMPHRCVSTSPGRTPTTT